MASSWRKYKTRKRDPSPQNVVLLVIDLQNHFSSMANPILYNALATIDLCRCASIPVLFTRHVHKSLTTDTAMLGEWWNELQLQLYGLYKIATEGGFECLLVKGWKGSSWSFPRRKKSKDEEDYACAIREVSTIDFTAFCRIGTEHEKFGFEVNTLRPMKYDQIAKLLNSIAERFEWEKFMEGDKIILSRRDFNMSVLAAYTRPNSVSEIVKVHCKHCCYC
ncbi:hypothetical protein HID58_013200 [Brassica napus]|uniref:Isochorismatase-like domain-containing protein n=1 Tax=Brassica napus TaxID=3708 RepID=A0ABQ8E5D9_BRANA|nr:hypothetical protein HID58_013200 [Brassica napus]